MDPYGNIYDLDKMSESLKDVVDQDKLARMMEEDIIRIQNHPDFNQKDAEERMQQRLREERN